VGLRSQKGPENRIECLFFVHQKQIEMLHAHPDILLMDCTYCTNRYRLPLLHIVGCTSLQTFFSAGFCFLRNESESDYHWAISNFLLKTQTPHPQVLSAIRRWLSNSRPELYSLGSRNCSVSGTLTRISGRGPRRLGEMPMGRIMKRRSRYQMLGFGF
jgi:hypothetical protein